MGHSLRNHENKLSTNEWRYHYDDVIMTTMEAQITSLTVVYSTVYSDANQRKHQSYASWPLCGNSPGPVNSHTKASYAENVSIWWRHHDYMCNMFSHQVRLRPRDLRQKYRSGTNVVAHVIRITATIIHVIRHPLAHRIPRATFSLSRSWQQQLFEND